MARSSVVVDHAPAPPPPPEVRSGCHDGTPPTSFNTSPFVETGRRVSEVAESAYKRSPTAYDVCPVPPYIAPIEVVADTTPAFAWSGPFSEPSVSAEVVRPPLNESAVVVALDGNG